MTVKTLTECDVTGETYPGECPDGMTEVRVKIPISGREVGSLDLHVTECLFENASVPEGAYKNATVRVLFAGTYDGDAEPQFGEAIGLSFGETRGNRFDPYVMERDAHENIEAICHEAEKRLLERGYEIQP